MTKHDESKDAERKPAKGAARDHAQDLSDSLRDLGNDKARIAADFLQESAENMKETGRGGMAKIDRRIRAKPVQSIGIAFAAGLVVSFLLGRR